MSTDTVYHSHSGVKDPKALQVAPLYPQKPSPSKNKTEPSNISLQASCHTFTVILRPFPIKCFPCGSAGKESACNVGDLGSIPGFGRSPGEGKGYPLQYSGLANCIDCIFYGVTESDTTEWLSLSYQIFQAVKLYGVLLESCLLHSPTREKSLLTGELESGTKIFWDHRHHGNSLQYTCLESPMDRGVWQATVHGVAQSQTQLKQLSMRADFV